MWLDSVILALFMLIFFFFFFFIFKYVDFNFEAHGLVNLWFQSPLQRSHQESKWVFWLMTHGMMEIGQIPIRSQAIPYSN